MTKSCGSIRCCYPGLGTLGRARGVSLEEPAAVILHGGVGEGGDLSGPWWTYTRTKLETVDRAKGSLQPTESPLLGGTRVQGPEDRLAPGRND
jgi:hypothetical protein